MQPAFERATTGYSGTHSYSSSAFTRFHPPSLPGSPQVEPMSPPRPPASSFSTGTTFRLPWPSLRDVPVYQTCVSDAATPVRTSEHRFLSRALGGHDAQVPRRAAQGTEADAPRRHNSDAAQQAEFQSSLAMFKQLTLELRQSQSEAAKLDARCSALSAELAEAKQTIATLTAKRSPLAKKFAPEPRSREWMPASDVVCAHPRAPHRSQP